MNLSQPHQICFANFYIWLISFHQITYLFIYLLAYLLTYLLSITYLYWQLNLLLWGKFRGKRNPNTPTSPIQNKRCSDKLMFPVVQRGKTGGGPRLVRSAICFDCITLFEDTWNLLELRSWTPWQLSGRTKEVKQQKKTTKGQKIDLR